VQQIETSKNTTCARKLSGGQWTLVHMQQQSAGGRYDRQLESLM